MNAWKTLFIKELKENRVIFAFLLLSTLCLEIIAVSSAGDGMSAHMVWGALPFASVFILPFVLMHSFSQELKGQTHYTLLSLPVHRHVVFLSKVAAVLSVGIGVFVLATTGVHLLYERIVEMAKADPHMMTVEISSSQLWLLSGMVYFSMLALFGGAASGIAGLRLVLRRFQGMATTAFVIGSVYVYARLGSLLDVGHFQLRGGHGLDDIQMPLMVTGYSMLFGLAMVGVGVLLFEKRAEA